MEVQKATLTEEFGVMTLGVELTDGSEFGHIIVQVPDLSNPDSAGLDRLIYLEIDDQSCASNASVLSLNHDVDANKLCLSFIDPTTSVLVRLSVKTVDERMAGDGALDRFVHNVCLLLKENKLRN